jgi:ribosomal protein S18 acetylase RimI-like enzyme
MKDIRDLVIFLICKNDAMRTMNSLFGNKMTGAPENGSFKFHPGHFEKSFDQYRIVRIKPDQRNLVAALFNQYRIYYNRPSNQSLAGRFIGDRLLNNESVIFAALVNNLDSVPVGFIQLYPKYSSLQAAKSIILNDLFVLPDYRNRGIALKLIEAAIKFAVASKSPDIQLETMCDNLVAQKLYESVGFKKMKQPTDFFTYFIKLGKE